MRNKERYPKECVLQYEDGWWITFVRSNGTIAKSHGAYNTRAMSEHDRIVLNNRFKKNATK
jgi:hypothetical protein